MRNLSIIIIFSFLSVLNIYGQSAGEEGGESAELSLRIKSMNFIKNNEYYNPVIEGYTMPGFFFQPEVIYVPSAKVTLRAGTHLLKYWGTEKFSQVKPVYSVTLNLSEKISFTIGTLSGSDSHRLFDPHFNSERLYNSYFENGAQFRVLNDNLFSDTWLGWENFIFKGDSTREIFNFGESFRYTFSPVAGFLHFEVPVQIQFKHFGGQISNYPEHVETYFNLAAGLRINADLANKRYGQVGVEYLQFINKVFAGESPSGISHGYSSWIRLHYTWKALYIGAAYWNAHDFYAPNGNQIYGSVSDYEPHLVIPDRRIISNFVYITFLPESYLELFLGLDTYYDVDLKRLDNSVTVHLNFDRLIKLKTFKH